GAGEGGVLAVDGSFDRRDAQAHLQVILAALDPAAWIEGLPTGALTGSARARGTLDDGVDAGFELRLERSPLAGAALGPVEIAGGLHDETLVLAPSRLVLPGAELRLRGSAARAALDLDGTLRAADAGAAGRFVARLLGAEPPPLDGAGTATFHLGGTVAAPTARARLALERLRWGAIRARGVDLDADLAGGALPAGSLVASVD